MEDAVSDAGHLLLKPVNRSEVTGLPYLTVFPQTPLIRAGLFGKLYGAITQASLLS